ncbi:MAG: RluA family pseudouridine synthase [Chloroflexi bacterium]|nr:RluA family pseudouridine synthase [Chloroflexota bacterium]
MAKNEPRVNERVHRLRAPVASSLRLDKFLAAELPQYSRARLQGLIKEGRAEVDGRAVKKVGFLLQGGETIELHVPPARPVDLIPEAIPLDVVFENDDVILINKPAGLVVHPAAGHATGTLIHAMLAHAPEIEGIGGELRPGLVHRLDKDTSGLIVLAKNETTQRFLQEQFQKREVEKTYIALVDGRPPTASGRVDAPIGRDPRERKRMAVVSAAKGRQAVTDYRVIASFEKHSLLELVPHTGRTHQIRVHLAFLGCPVVGDRVYGKRNPSLPLTRHFLHAFRLKLRLPGESKPRIFEAPLPDDLQQQLDLLKATNYPEVG